MIKNVKSKIKYIIIFLLIISFTINSYASLSASDGSAFVTKGEFDSALADFNSRLTTFEAGINSKIDSQVTSYLDRNGIWNGKKQTVEIALNTDTLVDDTSGESILIKKVDKSGMMFLPIYLHVDWKAGTYTSSTSGKGTDSINIAYNSVTTYMDKVEMSLVSTREGVEKMEYGHVLPLTLCGENDNANNATYMTKFNKKMAMIWMFFIKKDSELKLKMDTTVTVRFDWWAASATINKNYSTLSGGVGSNLSWITNSRYYNYFGIWGDTKVY